MADTPVLEEFAWSPVLVVDDDEASALLALKFLARAGLRSVDTVTDARLVADWVEANEPDLVLLDLHMPFLDGYKVLADLRERASSTELPVIVLTADDTLEASRRALTLGANDFLLKPLQPVELAHRVRNLLDMRTAHRSLQRRQRWLEEAERFTRELLAGSIGDPVRELADRATLLGDADQLLVSRDGADRGDPLVLAPPGAADSAFDVVLEAGGALREQLVHHAEPVLVSDMAAHRGLTVGGEQRLSAGTALLLPLPGPEGLRDVVGLVRRAAREPFTHADLDAAHQFVNSATMAMEVVDRRTDRRQYLDFFEILVSQIAEYAIVRLDVDGRVASWNAGAQRMIGYTAEDVAGRHVDLLFPDEEVAAGVPRRLLERAATTGRAHHQGWGVRSDGSRYWGEVSITALHDDNGGLVGYAHLTRDMTDARRLELARDSFFAALSHDIRTPLSSIQGFVELIPDVEGDRQDEFVSRVQSNVGRLTVLIENLLEHARLRAGAVVLDPKPLEAADVAVGCVHDLGPLLARHDVSVHGSARVVADHQALGRVLANLLVNASKYSPAGSPVEVLLDSDGDTGRIRVRDRGRGIAPEDLDRIFDEFERGSLAEPDGGTGLGLSSVRDLVTLQGGRVSIESAPGVGTTVTVELPAG